MFDSLLDDGLNPRFVFRVPVFRDEICSGEHLSRECLARHVVDAVDSFHAGNCLCPDATDVVRDLTLELLEPVTAAGAVRIDVWLEQLDATTCTYGFLCSSEDGLRPHARGERTISRIDHDQLRPASWSEPFRQKQSAILKTLHNYA